MFRGGGLVPSGNPMQNRNQASGILSSSDSLIDAVANDALSTQGGPTLSMNQGGVARFASGGSNTDVLQDIALVSKAITDFRNGNIERSELNAVKNAVLQKHGGVENLFAKLSPEQKEDPAVREVAFQLSPIPQAPYPPDARIPPPPSSEGLIPLDVSAAPEFDPSAAAPLNMGLNPNVPPELQPYLAQSGIRPVLERRLQIAQGAEPMAMDQTMVLNQPEPIAPMIGEDGQQIPSSMFDGSVSIDPNQGIVSATPPPELQREETRLSGFVPPSATISEDLMAEKPEPVIQGAVAPEELSTLERILAEDALIQREPGFTDAGDSWKQPNWSPGGALIEKATGPSFREQQRAAQILPVEEPSAGSGFTGSKEIGPKGEFDTGEVQPAESIEEVAQGSVVEDKAAQDPVVQAQEDLVIGTDSPGDDALAALQTAMPEVTRKSGTGDLLDDGTPEGAGIQSQAEQSAALIAEAADTDDQEDLDAKLQEHIDRFTKLMPKYEGKSEYEKGMDIVKMGMAIAAGESPNAITNISKGVLATIDNFTSNEKERRAYKQQIKLSAVKYGLANVAREHTELRADAKEGRTLFTKVFRVREGETFMHNGKELTGGNTVILTVDQVRSGKVDLNKLETEDSIAEGIKLNNARLKAQLDALQKSVTDPSKFEGPKEKYLENSATVRTNIATQGMLKNALVALNTDDVTGIKGTAKDLLLKIANATGSKEFSEAAFGKLTTKAEYVDFTERATTLFIEGLISEGGKISDFERGLARELSGAIGTQAFAGVTADTSILQRKIRSFVARLDADSIKRLKSMGLTEQMWDTRYNTIDKDRISYGQMLRDATGPLSVGSSTSAMIPGSVNWKDIISVAPDGITVVGLKPREEWNQ